MAVVDQITPISAKALGTVMGRDLLKMRDQTLRQSAQQSPSPFVSPNKLKGQRTAIQIQLLQNQKIAAQTIPQNGSKAFGELLLDPPSPEAMLKLQQHTKAITERIYANLPPLETPPFSPNRVLQAYKKFIADQQLNPIAPPLGTG
ncbi:MAG: hypothetical protein HQL51_17025 [Magnetococcales bacterium]|nr:hypothetical protein [Magnetococcales bacterium]